MLGGMGIVMEPLLMLPAMKFKNLGLNCVCAGLVVISSNLKERRQCKSWFAAKMICVVVLRFF